MSQAAGIGRRDAYHHGNLRNALAQAAVDLARAGGPDAVVLHEAARQVGVSAAASYHHFPGRDALLVHAKNHALAAISDFVLERLEHVRCDADPGKVALARLRAAGEGYLHFAAAEHGLFATAFCPGHRAPAVHDSSGYVLQTQALARLAAVLDELVAHGRMDPARRPGAEITAWSAVHGLAVLLDGPLRTMSCTAKQLAAQRTLDAVTVGLTTERFSS